MPNEVIEPEVIPVEGQNEPADIDVSAFETVEQIDAELNKLDGITNETEVKEELPPTPDKANEELPKSPAPAPEGQAEAEKQAVITNAVISKFAPEDQKILINFKGKPIEEALKSLVNAQRLVGKRQEQQPTQEVAKPYIPKDVAEKEQIEGIKSNLLLSRMKSKYGDYPTSKEEWAELSYQDPEKANEYLFERRDEKTKVQNELNQFFDLQKNFPKVNQNKIEISLENIGATLSTYGLEAKDLGVNLSPTEQESVINSLLVDNTGNGIPIKKLDENGVEQTWYADPSIVNLVGFANKFPIINEEMLQYKFYKTYMPKIHELMVAKARADGYKQAQSKTPPPSLSNTSFKGVQKTSEVLSDEAIKALSLEELDKQLERF